jgi:hypothetical protein
MNFLWRIGTTALFSTSLLGAVQAGPPIDSLNQHFSPPGKNTGFTPPGLEKGKGKDKGGDRKAPPGAEHVKLMTTVPPGKLASHM